MHRIGVFFNQNNCITPKTCYNKSNHSQNIRNETIERKKVMWMCSICGYEFDGEEFLNEDGYVCPLCESKDSYRKRDMSMEIEMAVREIKNND